MREFLLPFTKIETPDWCVEVTGVQNISDVVKTLKREKGYGVTYNGVITRSDRADFTVFFSRLLVAPLAASLW